jgi:hypothetical protein
MGLGTVFGTALGQDFPACLVGTQNRLQPPVLDFQDQQAAPRMQDDEVRVGVPRADGHVVPDEVVVVELLLEAFGQAPLALCHPRHASAQ